MLRRFRPWRCDASAAFAAIVARVRQTSSSKADFVAASRLVMLPIVVFAAPFIRRLSERLTREDAL